MKKIDEGIAGFEYAISGLPGYGIGSGGKRPFVKWIAAVDEKLRDEYSLSIEALEKAKKFTEEKLWSMYRVIDPPLNPKKAAKYVAMLVGKLRMDAKGEVMKRMVESKGSMNGLLLRLESTELLMEGATSFYIDAPGRDAKQAFERAKEFMYADYDEEERDAGYTGSILEKPGFEMMRLSNGMTPVEAIKIARGGPIPSKFKSDERYLKSVQDAYSDKWGPALCIELKKGLYAFFGMASE